ncbi:MAG: hypothetical protein ACOYJB_07475 [Christensenellaceae bacterium]|jgi:hypothetical protein
MQQNMGGYPPVQQKEKLGAILVLLAIRVIAGAVLGTLTGLSMVVQPLSGGAGMLTMIAGFLCVVVAVLLFARKPAFTWAFLIMMALNAIGGIVIAAHPAMQLVSMFLPAQKIFLILIIIMDVLFVVYLIRSKKVASIFGANLFRSAGGAPYRPAQQAQAYSAPQQAQPYTPQPQEPTMPGYDQPAQGYEAPAWLEPDQPVPDYESTQQQQAYRPAAEQFETNVQEPAYAQQPYQPEYMQQGQTYGQQAPPQQWSQPQYAQSYGQPQAPRRQMKRGAFVGLCIGISVAAVFVISLLMNNYYSNKYSSSSLFGLDSLFGSDDSGSSGLEGLFGFESGAEDWLFGSSEDSDEPAQEEDADLQGYVDNEVGRDVINSLYDMLKPGRSVEVSDIAVGADSYGLYIECYLPEDYYITGWDELNSEANEQNRKSVASVFKEDIYEKTGMQDAEISFVYYDEDGYYMTDFYY